VAFLDRYVHGRNCISNCVISVTKAKLYGRKAMSQNGRREFLTSAAAVAAALAACAAPVRRAQAQAGATCGSIYDESKIVPKVAKFVHLDAFQKQLITFPAGTPLTMENLIHNPDFVDRTLKALNDKGLTSVTVKSPPPPLPPGLSSGTYGLVSLSAAGSSNRSPVVLTKAQEAFADSADWSKILVFVIPDRVHDGHDITEDEVKSDICIHTFGM
jgi:hypothetical protein